MKIFKEDKEIKRVIFNVEISLAERLENAKDEAKHYGKKLDVDEAVNKAIEKFLKKAEKKLQELREEFEENGNKDDRPYYFAASDSDDQVDDAGSPGADEHQANNQNS